jgi:acetyltransferase-like isoleucine patch superfamily enzyme
MGRSVAEAVERAAASAATEAPAEPVRGLWPWLRFVRRNGMYGPRYWALALRYLWRFKVRNRHIATRGFVFLAPRTEVYCRRGLGYLELGRWVWIGKGTALRCHEGSLRVGDKTVFGGGDAVNAYLDVDIGRECILADGVHVTDFDHRFDDPATPIRKQGIAVAPVRIGDDCWIGEKVTVLRGVTIGAGSVIGAQTGVNRDVPPGSVAVGNPVRVVRRRGERREG